MKEKLCILEAVDQPRATVWDKLEQYADVVTVRDGECAYQMLCERKFDVVLVNLMLNGLDGLELLRRIRNRNLCQIVVLTSEFPDFQYAQQGILYGAFDYLLRPLTAEVLFNLILRAKERIYHIDYTYQKECTALVQAMGSASIMEHYDAIVARIAQQHGNDIRLDVTIRRLYQSVIRQVFIDMSWLGRFLCLEDYDALDWVRTADQTIVRDICRRKLGSLSNLIAELYPRTEDEKLNEILWYILEHIDAGYRQKDIAAAHYISSATLSDLFRNELKKSYRNHITDIKMRRAEYLLQHSSMKIYEISALLGYRDVNYFSRIFRQRYGVALSQFRHQNQLDYQI